MVLKAFATAMILVLTFHASRDLIQAGFVTRPNIPAVVGGLAAAAFATLILWMT